MVLIQYLLGTGISLFLASLGILIGHLLSPFHGFRPRITMLISAGALLAFNYTAFFYTILFFLFLTIITKNKCWSIFYVSLFLPLILWLSTTLDIYAIFGIVHGLLAVYQFVPNRKNNIILTGEINAEKHTGKILMKRTIAIVLIFTFITLLFFNRYVYRGFGLQIDIIRRGPQDLPLLALTFDDGPDPKYTPDILDILKEYEVPATFFVVGAHVEKYPLIAKRIVEEGHEIGNHTYSHKSLIPLSQRRIIQEIDQAHSIIEEITGSKPVLFRPPRGVYSDFAREYLREEGYTIVLWDVTSKDWSEISAREIANNVLNHVSNGSILLFHDSGNIVTPQGGNRINTVKALSIIIEELQDRGYKFVGLQELIVITGLTTHEDLEDLVEEENQNDYY